ncbi:hypothetical protein ACJIZ3_009309 [Penstemon smallii]|uniref:Uncharacterized protein n=1 Tax=Penstemon smallii TaxID=265156 RepID=A0ABD3TEF2_9LAMI
MNSHTDIKDEKSIMSEKKGSNMHFPLVLMLTVEDDVGPQRYNY